MACKFTFKELSLYLDGRYSGARGRELEEHISQCSACKARLKQISLMKNSLSNLTPITESAGFDAEFNRLLEKRLQRQGPPFKRWIERLKEILSGTRDTLIYPIPVAVRVAASFILVIALLLGARAQVMHKIPFVEFVAGDVKIYDELAKRWVPLEADTRLKSGAKIHSRKGALLNIVSRGKYKARLKGNSMIVIAKQKSGLRDIDMDFSLSYGSLLVNTTEDFKGSNMRIYTPSCDAEVVGTAFMIKALGLETWLGVLEGRVKVISKTHPLKTGLPAEAETYVSSGQKITVKPYKRPTEPELFSEKEWLSIQELYQLTLDQKIILIIGTGSNRIEELLGASPLYIYGLDKMNVPKDIPRAISVMIDAMKSNDRRAVTRAAKDLEGLLEKYPDRRYDVEILMFIGSHYHSVRDFDNALRIFGRVIKDYPDSALASLAQCAIATIYLNDMKDLSKAESNYRQLLESYPQSVDAIKAKEALSAMK